MADAATRIAEKTITEATMREQTRIYGSSIGPVYLPASLRQQRSALAAILRLGDPVANTRLADSLGA